MNKKQKKVLVRIIITVIIMAILSFVPAEGYLKAALYLIPYFIIGYDILKKGIRYSAAFR